MQITLNKNLLRDKYKKIRLAAKNVNKDNRIFGSLISCELFLSADTIFAYYSVKSEVDTLKFIDFALSQGKKVALPRCSDDEGNMDFYFIENTDKSLSDGSFFLKEPDVTVCSKATYGEKDLCIVPAIAFDMHGFRLGYGKGYYDRFLSSFQGKTVGLCYDECFCDELPRDKYDVEVDMIITDKKIYETK